MTVGGTPLGLSITSPNVTRDDPGVGSGMEGGASAPPRRYSTIRFPFSPMPPSSLSLSAGTTSFPFSSLPSLTTSLKLVPRAVTVVDSEEWRDDLNFDVELVVFGDGEANDASRGTNYEE